MQPDVLQLAPAATPAVAFVSVVIPVFNEEAALPPLYDRLRGALDALDRASEMIFVDDGSTDRSLETLLTFRERDPRVAVVALARNAGQHAAVLAGFAQARGDVVVTLDADLQNPPEEIPRLLEQIDAGHDVVGTIREMRRDPPLRRAISAAVSRLASTSVGVPLSDCGSMLRAYRRSVVEEVLRTAERALFIPALAALVAQRPTEIPIAHAARVSGRSRYSPLRFVRLGFDHVTGFSLLPIQLVSLTGLAVAVLGAAFGAYLFVRRLLLGPESEGLFTLFAILFVFLGVLMLAVGIVGEYVGRIYLEVRRRPMYAVRAVYVARGGPSCASS